MLIISSRLIPASLLSIACLSAQVRVVTNRYDAATTGANTHERVLTVKNVNSATFGKRYSYYVDGAVYAQPLYLSSVFMGRDRRNVLYVATMNDKVYAFDADRPGPPLWMRDFTDELAGITPVRVSDITGRNDLNIVGNVGIEGTPVIDVAGASLYVVVRTRALGRYVQRLHDLNIGTGKDQLPAVVIQAEAKSTAKDAVNGILKFDPKAGNQRPALALVKGKIVIAWASHEDIRPYHGWVMAYDAATLKQVAALCLTPDGADGGIWQSGRGPAVDDDGSIFFEVGNGDWDGVRNFGSSLVKLNIGNDGFSVSDYFTPHDYQQLNEHDADLGSTGPMLIPNTNLLLCGNKKGILYLLDKGNLGKMTPEDRGLLQAVEVKGGRDLAGPAYWDGPAGPTIYSWPDADFLKAFRFNGNTLDSSPFAKGSVGSRGSPGGAITISSDEKKPGTGIVWAALTNGKSADHGNAAGVLRAYDAESLKELWNSEEMPNRDRLGTLVKFVPPLVVGGRVYAPNYDNAVIVYGPLP
jgi:hypothetical protein